MKGTIYYVAIAMVIFSHVKISSFRVKAHLVFRWCLYNKMIYLLNVNLKIDIFFTSGALRKFVNDANGEEERKPVIAKHEEPSPMEEEECETGNEQLV